MPHHHRRYHCGFTLIELMCVLCIIGMLALFAYPSYQSHIRKARRTEARAALMQVMQQQERHFTQHNRYHAYSDAATAGAFKWFSGETEAGSAYRLTASGCSGGTLQECILLSATPTGGFIDRQCGMLTLNSRGEQTISGLSVAAAPEACR
jgi:type IV pilus assembly protein PilE